MEATWGTSISGTPLSGLWKPTQLRALHYGPGCVKEHLLSHLPSQSSKVFILSTSSLAKTNLLKTVEQQLGSRHAGTFTAIGQHAPVADLDSVAAIVLKDSNIDTIISVGGGSPIDGAKVISDRVHDKTGKFLFHITVPTTLSAAECTGIAGYTDANGIKSSVSGPDLVPHVIFYDAAFALETPVKLYLSTGIRALDHAVESMYHPTATEVPARASTIGAARDLFEFLEKYKGDPKNLDIITKLQLASFASLGFIGLNLGGGLGLSHAMGYALGSPYGIPHGITSCLTLGHVVKMKARNSNEDARQIARLAPSVGVSQSGDDVKDALAVGDAILGLVERLGLKTDLGHYKVGRDQVDVIAERATKAKDGKIYDEVRRIVEGLYGDAAAVSERL